VTCLFFIVDRKSECRRSRTVNVDGEKTRRPESVRLDVQRSVRSVIEIKASVKLLCVPIVRPTYSVCGHPSVQCVDDTTRRSVYYILIDVD
jgi:hypothetical protein